MPHRRSQVPAKVIPFPAHRERAPSPARGPARPGASDKITVLPAARPKELPRPAPRPRENECFCSAGKACAAYPPLRSPAKLSTHNRQEIDGKRYCYACLSRIAAERTRTIGSRKDSEAAASRRDRMGARQRTAALGKTAAEGGP